MSFMWRAPANIPPDFIFTVPSSFELGFRIFICVVLGVGVGYGVLILDSFRRYGTMMDEAWKNRVENFLMTYREDRPEYVPPRRTSWSYWQPEPGSPPIIPIVEPSRYPQPYPTYGLHPPSHIGSKEKLPRSRPRTPSPPDGRRRQHISHIDTPYSGSPKPDVVGYGRNMSADRGQPVAHTDTASEGRGRKLSVSRDQRRSRPSSTHTRTVSQTQQSSPYAPLPTAEPSKDPRLSRRTRLEVSC